jgi:hypothetical protein
MRLPFLVAAFSGLLVGAAMAETQTYTVSVGQRQLGTLRFEERNSKQTVLVTIDNAPLGIKSGSFQATAQAQADTVDHLAMNRGSETRDIALRRVEWTVTSVTVTPPSEMTELSDADKVPAGVTFPAEVFAAMATADTCPAPMSLYDGRRVVDIATTAMDQAGETLTCDMSYRVVMGPGYVSPLYFKSFGLQLEYTARRLARITMSVAGFQVSVDRQ